MSADRRHPCEVLREVALRGVLPQQERDRTTPNERASAAIRAGAERARARTRLPDPNPDDGQRP